MNDSEKAQLEALEQVLDLTDESDWNMVHATVRDYVAEGKLSKDGEQAYKVMVEKKLMERTSSVAI